MGVRTIDILWIPKEQKVLPDGNNSAERPQICVLPVRNTHSMPLPICFLYHLMKWFLNLPDQIAYGLQIYDDRPVGWFLVV